MSTAVLRCPHCGKLHRADLRCWRGRYVAQVAALYWSLHPPPRACWLGLPGCTGTATTLDHITPRSAGGGDELENLRGCCKRCNSRRGARAPFAAAPTPQPGSEDAPPLSPRWR